MRRRPKSSAPSSRTLTRATTSSKPTTPRCSGRSTTSPRNVTSWLARSIASMTCTTPSRPTASCSSSCARGCPRHVRRPRPSSSACASLALLANPAGLGQLIDRVGGGRAGLLRLALHRVHLGRRSHAGLHRERRERLRLLDDRVPQRGPPVGRQPPRRVAHGHRPRPLRASSVRAPILTTSASRRAADDKEHDDHSTTVVACRPRPGHAAFRDRWPCRSPPRRKRRAPQPGLLGRHPLARGTAERPARDPWDRCSPAGPG